MTAPLLSRAVAVRRANEADRTAIRAFVMAHGNATPFHLPEWSEAVTRGCGQRAVTLVAERPDGAIAGVLPLTHVRSPLFGQALVSCGFAVDGGALEEAAALASGARALAQEIGCPSVEFRGGTPPAGWHVDASTYLGFARALAADDEAQLLAIPRKQRAEVRKALAADLTVEIGRDADAHHAVYAASVRNLGTPVFPRMLFRAVLETMDADVLTVRHRGRAVASVLSLYWRDTVYPYWGGGTHRARSLRANDRMYFALMSHARARGCTRFDFGRSKAGTGAAAFKRNWGFAERPLVYSSWSDGPRRETNPLDPRFAAMVRAWQRLPLPIANMVGPWISRGLG